MRYLLFMERWQILAKKYPKIDLELDMNYCNIYRITAFLKVETNIITSITASQIGWDVIQIILYVQTFKTNVIVLFFIGNIIVCLASYWPIIFSITVSLLIVTISHGEIVTITWWDNDNISWWDSDNITWWDQWKNLQIINNIRISSKFNFCWILRVTGVVVSKWIVRCCIHSSQGDFISILSCFFIVYPLSQL